MSYTEIIGIIVIIIGLAGILFEKHPTAMDELVKSSLEVQNVSKPKSKLIMFLFSNRHMNIALIVLGLIPVILD